MSQLVTRCPHCSTSFHVSEEQLRAARGAVRCGSCLQVFRADENIVFGHDFEEDAAAAEMTVDDVAATGDEEVETARATDTAVNEDPFEPEDEPTPIEASQTAEDAPALPLDHDMADDDDFLIHDDMDLGDGDTAPETHRPAADAATPPPTDEPAGLIGDAFGETQWQELSEDDDEDLPAPHQDVPAPFSTEENPWADEIGDDTPIHDFIDEPKPEPTTAYRELPERYREGTGRIASEDTDAPLPAGEPPLIPEGARLISAIEPAPVQMSWQPEVSRRIPGWLWLLLVLLLIAGLAAQTAYFRFDTLSKRQPWRDLYALACPHLGCELPELRDAAAIRTSNLVVRSHPQVRGALLVDAVLLNTAPFAQEFPELTLSFSDLKDRNVASRRFLPSEYLQGELAGSREMPSGSPVHIAIEIVDPGSEAVNYELRIAE